MIAAGFAGVAQATQPAQGIHEAFLGHGIHYAQFWSARYDSGDPHYWYYVNLEDPNERGYDLIRRLFLLEFARTADHLR